MGRDLQQCESAVEIAEDDKALGTIERVKCALQDFSDLLARGLRFGIGAGVWNQIARSLMGVEANYLTHVGKSRLRPVRNALLGEFIGRQAGACFGQMRSVKERHAPGPGTNPVGNRVILAERIVHSAPDSEKSEAHKGGILIGPFEALNGFKEGDIADVDEFVD